MSTCISCLLIAPQVGAESTVQAIICRDHATLVITSPVSDSVVAGSPITVTGSVAQANQIEVMIDGQFNGVVPLDASATNFSTMVQLSTGTHTITLTAIDACQIGNATDSVVITYQGVTPDANGSVGTTTPTDVPGGGGVVIGDALPTRQTLAVPSTLFERLVQPLINVGRSLDIVPPSTTGSTSPSTPALIRIILLVIGFVIVLFSAQLAASMAGVASALGRRFKIFRRPGFIAIGAFLMVLAFVLA